MSLSPEYFEDLPENLSRLALRDFLVILRKSHKEFGVHTALETRERLLRRFRQIECGEQVGHKREDVHPKAPTLFVNEPPWVIVFDSETRAIKRVLHGAQSFPALFS